MFISSLAVYGCKNRMSVELVEENPDRYNYVIEKAELL